MDPPGLPPGKDILSPIGAEARHKPQIYLYKSSGLTSSNSSLAIYGYALLSLPNSGTLVSEMKK